MVAQEMRCPQCGADVPVDPRFVTWCDSCGWNVKSPQRPRAGRVERLYEAAGRRLGDRLVGELVTLDGLEPRWTAAKILAYAVAGAVHVFVIALVVGGVVLAVLAWPNVLAVGFAALLIAIAYLMRPRPHKFPERGVVSREQAPTLHALADDIADRLDVPRVDVICLTGEFNASWAVAGWRRRSVLTIGLPLFAVLHDGERVAVIAHEFAHGRNGDSTRGLVVGSALNSLSTLYTLLTPDPYHQSEQELLELPARVISWVLRIPIYLLLTLLTHLLLRDSQRAEFLADHLASRVAGTREVISLHEKLLAGDTVAFAIQRSAQHGADSSVVFAAIRDAMENVTPRERERRRRVARLETARLNETHPPTAHRIELLERRAQHEPLIAADPERSRAIDEETARYEPELAAKLVDDMRDMLYA